MEKNDRIDLSKSEVEPNAQGEKRTQKVHLISTISSAGEYADINTEIHDS